MPRYNLLIQALLKELKKAAPSEAQRPGDSAESASAGDSKDKGAEDGTDSNWRYAQTVKKLEEALKSVAEVIRGLLTVFFGPCAFAYCSSVCVLLSLHSLHCLSSRHFCADFRTFVCLMVCS